MVPLSALWLPVVVSAVLVFVASSVIHMALGYHNGDYGPLPREDDIIAALRPMHISLSTTLKSTVDGLLYACLTAGAFGWLWPN